MFFNFNFFPIFKWTFILFIGLLLTSCKKEYQFEIKAPETINLNQNLGITIEDRHSHSYDSVRVYLDSRLLKDWTAINISDEKLGRRVIKAEVFYDNQQKTLMKPVYFFASKVPDIYDYKVVKVYPHDPKAYTQGLEYHKGYLYESTGQRGHSSLRQVELKTGKVLKQIDLPSQYFAEGMTIFGDKIFQLTWQNQKGFVYDLKDFSQEKTFDYKLSKEGWGLTHDSTFLIKTDGTDRVWFLNPDTQEESHYIEAYTNKQSVKNLNELEFINGKVYANVYLKNIILILNPENGAIEGVVDLNPLEKEVRKTQNLVQNDEVLNGIAYDAEHDRIFVTGKHWSKLFEIEIFKRQ